MPATLTWFPPTPVFRRRRPAWALIDKTARDVHPIEHAPVPARRWRPRVLAVVVVLSTVFGIVNGIHDAGNAIAAPIVTRAIRPGSAVALAAVFHVAGALLVGTAVAATVAGVVAPGRGLPVLGAAILGATAFSMVTLWRGLPCSSGHCLVGALAGSAMADGGVHAVHWGGLHGVRPVGVIGSLLWLLVSAAVAMPIAALGIRVTRRALRRATTAIGATVRRGEVVTAAALAFAHGSNDAQKTMGVTALALVAAGHLSRFTVPVWVALLGAGSLTLGTSLGGWRVVRTLGRGIYPLQAIDGLVSQGAASTIVLLASVAGAPVSTTDVVAPAVVGVGAGARWHHVRWSVVKEIALAWLVTLPASAALAALALPLWRVVA